MLLFTIIPIISHLLVPALFVVLLWRGGHDSRAAWLARTAAFGGYIMYLFLAGGAWHWVSYYFRFLYLFLFIVAAVVSWRRARPLALPWWRRPPSGVDWINLIVEAVLGVYFLWAIAAALTGLSPGASRPAQMTFPLRGGVSYVVQGGDNPILNYHNVNPAQRYALDIVVVNGAGIRAAGLYPPGLDRYVAFGRPIYSPCSGEVLEVENDLPDLQPPEADSENLAGNHVVVRCDGQGVDVLLAHMMAGSVAVTPGQQVQEGGRLGSLGNSGNTSEPHLHIHAVRTGSGSPLDGEGVPIRFDGRFLVRNNLFRN